MKKIQKSLWLAGLLVGSSTMVANAQEGGSADQFSNTLVVKASAQTLMSYDLRNYYAEPGFSIGSIPMNDDRENRKRLLFNVPNVVLKVEKKLSLLDSEAMRLVVETKMAKDPAVKNAYADFRGFRVGKALTSFFDPCACDLVAARSVQVQWQYPLSTLLSLAVAAEEAPDWVIHPATEEDKSEQSLKPYKNIPAFAARIKGEEDNLWHVQLGGLMRILEYRNADTSKDFYLPAWGATLGTSYHLIPKQTILKLQGVYGQGIGSYIAHLQDLEKENNTVYTTGSNTLECKKLSAWGAGAGISHKWLSVLRSDIGYTMVSAIEERDRPKKAYKYGHSATASVSYLPIEQLEIGIEYLLGIRKNISGDPRDAHRVQVVAKFSL